MLRRRNEDHTTLDRLDAHGAGRATDPGPAARGVCLRRSAAQSRTSGIAVEQYRPHARHRGGQDEERDHLHQGARHQGRPQSNRDPPQHRQGRLRAARVADHHELGRGRQGSRVLPQRLAVRDVYGDVLVSMLRQRQRCQRLVGHDARRAVPSSHVRGQGEQTHLGLRGRDGGQGSDRAVHGGRQQGGSQGGQGTYPALQGEPQTRLQPEARFRRLGRRGLPLAVGDAGLHAHFLPHARRSRRPVDLRSRFQRRRQA